MLAVVLQAQSVEVQLDSVLRVGLQPPLVGKVGGVGSVREARRLDAALVPRDADPGGGFL